ncbi:MAG: DNA polymerase III subunit beta [Verrucomicrobia bacterium]|jgi:DNA polymerase-3 subunit beta|nr:DNA polymerase III subunit beta [Verrucomicrobiota bacterium]
MKLAVTKEALLEGLQRTQNVVSNRPTLPILTNALLEADEEGLWITTTDLEVGIRCRVEARVEKTGSTTLPARKLVSIIRELPSSEIILEVDSKNAASIRCGASFFKIFGLPKEEFPAFPAFEEPKSLKIRQSELKDGLRKTSYAISSDEARYVLNGILFSLKDNKLMLVATDGRRLALFDSDLEFPESHERDFILPTKAVTELQRLLSEDGEVEISSSENLVSFELNGARLVSKLVEGNYPNYRQVIPGEAKERIALEREAFHNCVRRVSILSSDKTSSVRLNFTKNNLDITANTPEVGEAKESMSINYKGRDISIAFNPEFLMDPLRNLPNDEVFLELIDEMSPGVIKIQTPFLYVIMPMRVSA